MRTRKVNQRVYKTYVYCDKCSKHMRMDYTGTTDVSLGTVLYQHKCMNPECGNLENYEKIYPSLEFEDENMFRL